MAVQVQVEEPEESTPEEGFIPRALEILLDRVNPTDVFILSAGAWLGWHGFSFPDLELGPFKIPGMHVGTDVSNILEDIRLERLNEAGLLRDLEDLQRELAHIDEGLRKCLEEAGSSLTDRARCKVQWTREGKLEQVAAANASLRMIREAMAQDVKRLRQYRTSDALVASLIAFALTRPGFIPGVLQGIGEVIPG